MIIVMQHAASAAELAAVVDKIRQAGLTEHVSRGTERTLTTVFSGRLSRDTMR